MNDLNDLLLPGERVDDLQCMGLRIIQSPDSFRFGMDAVLLADFTRPRPRSRISDLGTGTGILPLLLYGRENTITCDAVEIQPDASARAERTMRLTTLFPPPPTPMTLILTTLSCPVSSPNAMLVPPTSSCA